MVHLLGFLGFAILLWGAIQPTRFRLLSIDAVGLVMLGIYWVLLGSPVAALMNVVFFTTNLLAIGLERGGHWRWIFWVNYPLMAICVHLGYARLLDLLIVVGALLTIVSRHQTQLQSLRWVAIASSLPWLIYGVALEAWAQVAFSVLFIVFTLLASWRDRGSSDNSSVQD